MKKLLFGTTVLLLMGACSGSNSSKMENQDVDTVATIDTVSQAEDEALKAEQARLDSLRQDSIAKAEKIAEAAAQYDPILNNYEALINKCWSMSKKGMSINDQELADVWMQAGNVGSKLDKAKKNLTPEQQSRLKKLNKDYEKFCRTQPA